MEAIFLLGQLMIEEENPSFGLLNLEKAYKVPRDLIW